MIHQYKLGGYNIILDICSGSVHAVDDVTYDLIAGFENTERDALISEISSKYPDIDSKEIGEIYDELLQLKEDGKLFTEDEFEPKAGVLKAKTNGVVKALCLHIAIL